LLPKQIMFLSVLAVAILATNSQCTMKEINAFYLAKDIPKEASRLDSIMKELEESHDDYLNPDNFEDNVKRLFNKIANPKSAYISLAKTALNEEMETFDFEIFPSDDFIKRNQFTNALQTAASLAECVQENMDSINNLENFKNLAIEKISDKIRSLSDNPQPSTVADLLDLHLNKDRNFTKSLLKRSNSSK